VEEQDQFAAHIIAEIEDEKVWSEQFARGPNLLRRLADEALEEQAQGNCTPLSDML
jgi:hypothetical protein